MRKPLDNLTRDVIAAERLGYGCHYGHYKADHPHIETEAPEERDPELRACTECGTLFLPVRDGRFCCKECRNRNLNRENYRKKHRKEK